MNRPEEYGISVRLVQEDGADIYEARVLELPDVRTYGSRYSDAYNSAVEVIRTTQQIFAEKGKAFPDVELPEDEFSGRITLRMSKSLHRSIHSKAQLDNVSLNQWIVEAVASRVDGRLISSDAVYVANISRNHVSGGMSIDVNQAHYMSNVGHGGSLFVVLPALDGYVNAPTYTDAKRLALTSGT
jgi:predicted HicB family RNase H-like nuclease